MRYRRVVVTGGSISMIVRPRKPDAVTYPAVLESLLNRQPNELWLVDNRSRLAGTCADFVRDASSIVAARPDVVVVHHGYNEALRRPRSRSVWMFEHMYRPPSSRAITAARWASMKASRVRSLLHLTQHWVGPAEFQRSIAWAVKYLQTETDARIVTIGITPWSEALQRYAPGSDSCLRLCDGILRDVSLECGADYISFADLVSGFGDSEVIPDGTHFSTKGHLLVASRLAEIVGSST